MKTIKIHSLCYQPSESRYEEPYHFNRVAVDAVKLIANHGIEGDSKAGRNAKRQLNIMSLELLETMRAEGFKTEPGEMGEQIQISGLDVMTLKSGDRLQIGDSAIIEIGKPRTGCSWFELIQQKPVKSTVKRLGMLAQVITSGEVRVGDPVTVLERVTDS